MTLSWQQEVEATRSCFAITSCAASGDETIRVQIPHQVVDASRVRISYPSSSSDNEVVSGTSGASYQSPAASSAQEAVYASYYCRL